MMPFAFALPLLLLHAVIPAVLGSVWTDVENGVGSAANQVGAAANQVGSAANEAGTAVADGAGMAVSTVEDAAGKAGHAVEDASQMAARAAADTALQQSGKCDEMIKDRHIIQPTWSALIARGMQESQEDPSKDEAACSKVVLDVVTVEMDREWNDATGLSGKVVAGLSGELLSYVCGPPLMGSLRKQEASRERYPETYKVNVEAALLDSVFTDAWIRDALQSHCGEFPHADATRLFTVSSPMRMGPWSMTSLSGVATTAWISGIVFSAALFMVFVAAALRQRRHTVSTLLSHASSEDGGIYEDDEEAME